MCQNFICLTIKFHNCYDTNVESLVDKSTVDKWIFDTNLVNWKTARARISIHEAFDRSIFYNFHKKFGSKFLKQFKWKIRFNIDFLCTMRNRTNRLFAHLGTKIGVLWDAQKDPKPSNQASNDTGFLTIGLYRYIGLEEYRL